MPTKTFLIMIKRKLKHFWQRRTRGFDNSELWNLDLTIARFIAPRLRAFIDEFNNPIVPVSVGQTGALKQYDSSKSEEWKAKLEKMHKAFQLIVDSECAFYNLSTEQQIAIEDGLDLFRKHFHDLWD